MKKKLFLIAGHHAKDSGATSTVEIQGVIYKYFENKLCVELRDLIHDYFKTYNPETQVYVDNDNHSLTEVISEVAKRIKKGDVLFDIHFNAFHTSKANGGEIIVKNGSAPDIMTNALMMSKEFSTVLGITDRGAKDETKTARKRIGILHGEGDRYLYEVCFMTSPTDMFQYEKFKHLLVDVIVGELESLLR